MTSSIKPEVHNVSSRRHRRTEPRPQIAFGEDRTCSLEDMIADRRRLRRRLVKWRPAADLLLVLVAEGQDGSDTGGRLSQRELDREVVVTSQERRDAVACFRRQLNRPTTACIDTHGTEYTQGDSDVTESMVTTRSPFCGYKGKGKVL